MSWLHLFFDPRGCIKNRQFGVGSIILILIVLIVSMLWYYLVTLNVELSNRAVRDALFNFRLCLMYPFFCLLVKRLHASGKSGLWAVLIISLFLILSFIAQSGITIYYMLDAAHMDEERKIWENSADSGVDRDVLYEQARILNRQMLHCTYLPVIGVYLLLLSIGCAAISRMKIKAQNNKYNANYLKVFD